LPRLFAELGCLRVGGAQCLITAKGIRRKLAKLTYPAADFLMVLIPIHDHGFLSCRVKRESRVIILPARANMISSPVHPSAFPTSWAEHMSECVDRLTWASAHYLSVLSWNGTSLPECKAIAAARRTPSSCAGRLVELIPRSRIHEERI